MTQNRVTGCWACVILANVNDGYISIVYIVMAVLFLISIGIKR